MVTQISENAEKRCIHPISAVIPPLFSTIRHQDNCFVCFLYPTPASWMVYIAAHQSSLLSHSSINFWSLSFFEPVYYLLLMSYRTQQGKARNHCVSREPPFVLRFVVIQSSLPSIIIIIHEYWNTRHSNPILRLYFLIFHPFPSLFCMTLVAFFVLHLSCRIFFPFLRIALRCSIQLLSQFFIF